MNTKEIRDAFLEMDALEFYLDVVLAAFPIMGVAAFMFGLIDLDYDFSREQGIRRVVSFVVSHGVYVAAAFVGTA